MLDPRQWNSMASSCEPQTWPPLSVKSSSLHFTVAMFATTSSKHFHTIHEHMTTALSHLESPQALSRESQLALGDLCCAAPFQETAGRLRLDQFYSILLPVVFQTRASEVRHGSRFTRASGALFSTHTPHTHVRSALADSRAGGLE
jgi:hypothetical protein